MMAENPLLTILFRALFTMIVCYAIGLVIGMIAQSAIQKHIEQHKRDYPIPGEEMEIGKTANRANGSQGSTASAG